MKTQITQSWLGFVFRYGFEHTQFCWKVQRAQGAFVWRQTTFWESLQWLWLSHHNHLWNFIVQLGCLLVITKQKFITFQGTVTRREACVKTIQTWNQDPLYKQTYQYKTLNLLSQKILPPNWSHFITTLAQLERDPKPSKVKGRISIDFWGVWMRS